MGALCMRWMCLVRAVLVPKMCSHCEHWYINVLAKCLLSTWHITSGLDRFLNSWQIWQKYPFWPISFEAYLSKSSNDLTGPATNMTSHKSSSSFLSATQHLCLVVINSHVIVEGTLRRHLLLTYVAVVLEHAGKVNALTVVPHSNSTYEPLSTDRAYPLILSRVRVFIFLDKLK